MTMTIPKSSQHSYPGIEKQENKYPFSAAFYSKVQKA
jgi:hypothetical protein